MPAVSATQEADAGKSLEPRKQRLQGQECTGTHSITYGPVYPEAHAVSSPSNMPQRRLQLMPLHQGQSLNED
ncbi:hypothetical protein AAY473_000507 [Plecturocebus cupreus]